MNFVILIGGPGTYESHDAKHDKIWINYFYPMQVAAEKDLYNRGGDQVHWVVYEPAYHVRWLDDSEITFLEGLYERISGSALHKVRGGHADDVRTKGAANYVDRIRKLAHANTVTYKGIKSPKEFWDYLQGLPPRSISRVWYSGHANEDGLILRLTHENDDRSIATIDPTSVVPTAQIEGKGTLKDRFVADVAKPSKFYGCGTAQFAKKWHDTFGVPTEGAQKSITFAKVLTTEPGKLFDTLETTPTGKGVLPLWTPY